MAPTASAPITAPTAIPALAPPLRSEDGGLGEGVTVEVVTIESSEDVVDVAGAKIGAVDLVVSVTAAVDPGEPVT